MPDFVAEVGDEIVGFLLGDFRGPPGGETNGWIDMLGVMPDYQSMGIGRKLVEAFCEQCRKEGVRTRVVVLSSNTRLTRFWERAGFHKGDLVSYER
jgi:ribosomal protein S18 acetylase RimI-like enzyme